jgi:hypothetical protein
MPPKEIVMSTNGHQPVPTAVPKRREFHLSLHILEHPSEARGPRYTVSVWDPKLSPPGLRALCSVRPLTDAVFAIAAEITASDQRKEECVRFPRWSSAAKLIERLRERNDPDSEAAADEIAELFGLWRNTAGDLEMAQDRLKRLGALAEEAASKAHPVHNDGSCPRSVVIPENVWSKLLAAYRHKQEGCAVYRELQLLRELAGITADTLRTVENWLGNAGTRESAMDSLWRLGRIVQSMGYELPMDNLRWRGQLVRALEQAGVGLGSDDAIRVRLPEDKYWEPARGPLVKTLLESIPQNF